MCAVSTSQAKRNLQEAPLQVLLVNKLLAVAALTWRKRENNF
jgi:hypothetical protein